MTIYIVATETELTFLVKANSKQSAENKAKQETIKQYGYKCNLYTAYTLTEYLQPYDIIEI